jgi:hypothetical protein
MSWALSGKLSHCPVPWRWDNGTVRAGTDRNRTRRKHGSSIAAKSRFRIISDLPDAAVHIRRSSLPNGAECTADRSMGPGRRRWRKAGRNASRRSLSTRGRATSRDQERPLQSSRLADRRSGAAPGSPHYASYAVQAVGHFSQAVICCCPASSLAFPGLSAEPSWFCLCRMLTVPLSQSLAVGQWDSRRSE